MVGQLAGGGVEVRDDIDDRLGGGVGVGVVCEDGVGRPLMLPSLEHVPDGVRDGLPRVVGALCDLEEGEAVLGVFATARGESA